MREGKGKGLQQNKPYPSNTQPQPQLQLTDFSMADSQTSSFSSSKLAAPSRPTLALPPRSSSSFDAFFFSPSSPGPMTILSSFFSDSFPDSDCRSFSQLLAGAMSSPSPRPPFPLDPSSPDPPPPSDKPSSLGFRHNRPMTLAVARSPLFSIPPGFSPSGLLNSPGFFSPLQSPFGMSHQQALAQVTAQAALSQSHMFIQADYPLSSYEVPVDSLAHDPSSMVDATTNQPVLPIPSDPKSSMTESSEVSHSDRKSQPPPLALDKPGDDGYNWRKYGQKHVKGSDYPRSYYKCTHLNCPVKKKVERSHDGQITEIIYKGQHNHEVPKPNKRAKDGSDLNGHANSQYKAEIGSQGQVGSLNRPGETVPASSVSGMDQETTQAMALQVTGSSDSEEVGDAETRVKEDDNDDGDDEPNPKRRNIEVAAPAELVSSHKTVTEPRIIVQTRSEVDLLDDGYRWRKYGQKVVKGNPHPRSYYKCTSPGCNVRKHVERASTDPKAVITTYEGKHNHDVPAARSSSHNNTANSNAAQLKQHNVVAEKPTLVKELGFRNRAKKPVALLQLKDEQIAV